MVKISVERLLFYRSGKSLRYKQLCRSGFCRTDKLALLEFLSNMAKYGRERLLIANTV